jgi:SAM-dependent methyltransferase
MPPLQRADIAGAVTGSGSHCTLCGAGADAQVALDLRTSGDLRELGEYGAVLCTRCNVARTEPAPHDVARVISPDVQETALGIAQQALMRRFMRQRVARVRPLLPTDRRPRVADIGGGACAFANALGAAGCDVVVFEPNPANWRFADTSAGVAFVPAPFDEGAVATASIADGSLDGITMWHSLEHVPDPAATLALARRLLRPGGVLYVCVPNLDSMQAGIGGTRWCYVDIPHHVTHFTLKGLEATMRRAGFGEFTTHWWNAEYEVFGWYQTLLNLLTGSHNFFYNRAKKGKQADAGPNPRWTRAGTALGPLLMPIVVLASWLGTADSRPACAEVHGSAP